MRKMNSTKVKLMILVSALLLTIMMVLAFLTAPYVGSAYIMLLQGVGDQLPNLTLKITLPLLRVSLDNPHPLDMPVTQAWAGAVWLLMIIAPLGAACWAWLGDTRDEVTIRWLVTISIYMPTFASLFIIISAGLVVPFACM